MLGSAVFSWHWQGMFTAYKICLNYYYKIIHQRKVSMIIEKQYNYKWWILKREKKQSLWMMCHVKMVGLHIITESYYLILHCSETLMFVQVTWSHTCRHSFFQSVWKFCKQNWQSHSKWPDHVIYFHILQEMFNAFLVCLF